MRWLSVGILPIVLVISCARFDVAGGQLGYYLVQQAELNAARNLVSITESGNSTAVTEGGATDTFDIVLLREPQAAVDITITPDSQLTVNGSALPITLTFTPADWSTPRTITVAAVDDPTAEGSHTGAVTESTSSTDSVFDSLALAAITVAITDNDTAGVSVVETTGSTDVTEGGATDSYTLVLNTPPVADVFITITPDSQLTVNGSATPITLTFTTATWDGIQTVNVAAADDPVIEGAHSGVITHQVSSGDGEYDGLSVAGVTAGITDNDAAGVTISETLGSTDVTEGGATDTYSLVLDTLPASDVVITVTPDSQITVNGSGSPVVLTFTPSNWDTTQDITVAAVVDTIYEPTHPASSITHTASSGDGNYDALPIVGVTVNVTDNPDRSGNWWSGSYGYRRRIVFGTAHSLLNTGYTATLPMDTTIATTNVALAGGNDVRIVWQRTSSAPQELDRLGAGWNTDTTAIDFRLQSDIPADLNEDTDGAYFVYYGNAAAGTPPADEMKVYYFADYFNRSDNTDIGNGWTEVNAGGGSGNMLISSGRLGSYGADLKPDVFAEQTFSLGAIPGDFTLEFDWTLYANAESYWTHFVNIGNSATMVTSSRITGVGPGIYLGESNPSAADGYFNDLGDIYSVNSIVCNTLVTDPCPGAQRLENLFVSEPVDGTPFTYSFQLVIHKASYTYDYYRYQVGTSTLLNSGVGNSFVNNENTLNRIRIGNDYYGTGTFYYDNIRLYLNVADTPEESSGSEETP